jgi:enolase
VQPDAICRLHAREVLDSRGNPTVEVEVSCQGGAWGRAVVPSGASTGRHEAKELRDGDMDRFAGLGVRNAVTNIKATIAGTIHGLPVTEQALIDRTLCDLDGTPDKSRLGANALLGVSLACAHAAAAFHRVTLWRYLADPAAARLPFPMVNLISGGLHAGGNLDFQDFLLLPIGARSYSEALQMTVAVYRSLGKTLQRHGFEGVLVGDEGGYGPRLHANEQAVELILEAISQAGFQPGKDAAIALDVASSHFYQNGAYHLRATDSAQGFPTPRLTGSGSFSRPGCRELSADDLASLLEQWVMTYPIRSIEDGMAEDDWSGWKTLTTRLGKQVQLIGDDLFVTHPERLRRGMEAGVANAVLVKVNQIGTLTETLDVIALARSGGYRTVISARSGETEDSTIADLAVATGVGQIKIGSVARSERLAKYNQLLRIEEEMGGGPFAAWRNWE